MKDRNIIIVLGTLNGLGGAEKQAIVLTENLVNRGYKVKIVAFSGGSAELILKGKGIDYVIYSFKPYQPFRNNIIPLVKLTLFLRKQNPYAFIPFLTLNSKYIGLIWKFTGAKFACWNQRDEGLELYGSMLEKISVNNVPVVISNSISGKNVLNKKLGVSEEKIVVINNGIVIPQNMPNKSYWRKMLGISSETLIVSMIANISRYKDHFTVLKAWNQVQKYHIENKIKSVLILAGKFLGMEDTLKIMAFDLRIADTVYFIGAISDVNALINESDLIVHSSKTEGCPNAVLEAMALKKAVIGTDIFGIRHVIGDQYADACLCDPDNFEMLASRIIHLLEDNDKRNEIGNYNYHRVKNDFSVSQMVCNYLNVINSRLNLYENSLQK